MDPVPTDRQSQIIELLSGQLRPVAVPEVARRLGCSERTVHREIEALRHIGVEIVTEPGRRGGLSLKRPIVSSAKSVSPDNPHVPAGPAPVALLSPGDEFVGRDAERGQLELILDDVIAGEGRVVMILGEPGIGKTRLTRELTSRAEARGVTAVWGRFRDIEGAPPYWPWTQAFRALVDERGTEFTTALSLENARDLAAAMPEFASLLNHADLTPSETRESSQFQLFDAFTRLLKAAASDAPLIVVLDDLHWADAATLGLLEFMSAEIESSQIMVVGTARTVDPTIFGRLASTLAELARSRGFSRVELDGLSRDEVSRLTNLDSKGMSTGSMPDDFFSVTEGNPFFAIEMSRLYAANSQTNRTGPSALPASVKDVIERRLSGLSDDCLRVLRTGSVLGYRFEYEQLVAACDPDLEKDPLELMDEALDARVVSEPDGPGLTYEFSHALIHRFLYDEMPTGRRLRLHARVAEELERSHGDNAAAHSAELAMHFNEAKSLLGVENAVKYSTLAAEQALAAYSPIEAINHFERAIDLNVGLPDTAETGDRYFGLGRAWNEIYKSFEVVEALTRAFDIYEKEGETEKAIQVASFGITRGMGEAPAQVAVCERGLALVEPGSLAEARILGEYAAALSSAGDLAGCLETLARAIEIARREEEVFLEAHCLANLAFTLGHLDRFAEAITTALQVLDLASQIDDPKSLVGLGHRIASTTFCHLGEFEEARPHFEAGIKYGLSLPGTGKADHDYAMFCQAALAQGQWDEARHISSRRLSAHSSAPEFGLDAHLEFMTGSEETAIATLSDIVRDTANTDPESTAHHTLMLAAVGLMSDNSDAIELAAEVADADFGSPYGTDWLAKPSEIVRYLCDTALRDSNAAALAHDGLQKYRQTWANAGVLIGADRALALSAAVADSPTAAAVHFSEGIAFCKKSGLRPELAWTYHDFVSFQLKQGGRIDRSEALKMVDEGLKLTNTLGMVSLQRRLEELRDAVVALGGKPQYPDGLTPREVEVLRLIATGRSNRQIAEDLIITESTAAKHVANILSKTESANRVEAANYAGAQDLLDTSSA
ncbi:MAG: AAA family ATPase [Chloroflexi bacterium]|nr:AAA family ATPase [Chloroflexota bacterium]